jgi:hypothetical protein
LGDQDEQEGHTTDIKAKSLSEGKSSGRKVHPIRSMATAVFRQGKITNDDSGFGEPNCFARVFEIVKEMGDIEFLQKIVLAGGTAIHFSIRGTSRKSLCSSRGRFSFTSMIQRRWKKR